MEEADKRRYGSLLQAESPHLQQDMATALVDRPAQIRVPMLVLGAGNDWFLAKRAIRRTARAYRTEAIIFEGMAHDMMLEPDWQRVAKVIVEFLRTSTYLISQLVEA